MTYVLTQCQLPESLLTGASHKRFQTLITKATAAAYGQVEVKADATGPGM